MKTYSTKQAAEMTGIHPVTLRRWLLTGKIKASQSIRFDGQTHWRWTARDVEKIRKLAKSKKG